MPKTYAQFLKELNCPFCQIIKDNHPDTLIRQWPDAVAFAPLNPVVLGHTLVVPRVHVRDATTDFPISTLTMLAAVEVARDWGPCNIITSVGAEATQTVFHLHIHVIPRRKGDGLALPWTGQKTPEPS